jgi:hypothetical protein
MNEESWTSQEPTETKGPRGRLQITEADLAAPTAVEQPFAPASDGVGGNRDWTEATRLMCVAAYLDGRFAQEVVDEVVNEEHRAVHVPTGVDIATVARHCLAASLQKTVRDLLLSADLVLAIVLFLVKHSLSWLLYGYLLAAVVVLWDIVSSTLIVVRRLSPHRFSAQDAPIPSGAWQVRRIEQLARDQRGNLTVYSGFSPFSGAGLDVGGWSFLIDLRKGKADAFGERLTPREPTARELYDTVEGTLGALQMPNLEIRDRLFVNGSDVRDDQRLLPNAMGPPQAWVEGGVVERYMTSPTQQIRHYRCIEIVDWRGELVLSLFLRFAISNGRLFCELNKLVLVPLKEELHRLNHMGGRRVQFGDVLAMVLRALITTPGLSLRAPRVILGPFRRSHERSSSAKQVENDPYFDYGARTTALDRVRSTRYRRYFQRLDKEMYDKVLERTVLDAIVEILDRHGIDTAEIDERRAMIINNGIMMGREGTINAANMAVGQKPGIHINIPRPGGSGGGGEGAPRPQSA